MKLFIDTSNSEKIVVGIDGKKHTADSKKQKAQMLLPLIGAELKKNGKKIEDVTEIEVVTGPGSFTGLRVGVSIANTLGWVLNVPVNGKDVKKSPVVPNY